MTEVAKRIKAYQARQQAGGCGADSTRRRMVAQRTREFGLRMALGATNGEILKMVLRQGLSLGAGGIAIGFAGSLAAGRAMRGMVFGFSPTDPLTLVLVTLLLGAAVACASVVPVRRATQVDPAVAPRAE